MYLRVEHILADCSKGGFEKLAVLRANGVCQNRPAEEIGGCEMVPNLDTSRDWVLGGVVTTSNMKSHLQHRNQQNALTVRSISLCSRLNPCGTEAGPKAPPAGLSIYFVWV